VLPDSPLPSCVIEITFKCDLDHSATRLSAVQSVLLWECHDHFPYWDRIRKPTLDRLRSWVISPMLLWEKAHPRLA